MSKELPLGPILAAGFANIKRVWSRALMPLTLLAAIPTVFAFVDPVKLRPQNFLLFVSFLIVSLVWFLVATGLAYRLAAREAAPQKIRLGLLGLQWGTMEERYLLSSLFVGLINAFYLILVVFLVLVFAAIIAYGRGQGLTMNGMPAIMNELGASGFGAVMFAAILGLLGWILLMVRLSLSQVVSLYSGKVQVLSSTPLTKGRVLALLLPLTIVVLLATRLTFTLSEPSRIALSIASGLWTIFVQIPFSAGVFASIYQRLKPADKVESVRPDSALGNGSNDGVFTD
ncbi:MAG: hypothetical protein RJA87_372 [Pseudomonadota bacterium]